MTKNQDIKITDCQFFAIEKFSIQVAMSGNNQN